MTQTLIENLKKLARYKCGWLSPTGGVMPPVVVSYNDILDLISKHKAECEPVSEVVGTVRNWSDIKWHTALVDIPVGTNLYTAPPDQSARIAELEAQRDRFLQALKPLSDMASHYPLERIFGNRPTSGTILACGDSTGSHEITVEDCHIANALIAEIEASK